MTTSLTKRALWVTGGLFVFLLVLFVMPTSEDRQEAKVQQVLTQSDSLKAVVATVKDSVRDRQVRRAERVPGINKRLTQVTQTVKRIDDRVQDIPVVTKADTQWQGVVVALRQANDSLHQVAQELAGALEEAEEDIVSLQGALRVSEARAEALAKILREPKRPCRMVKVLPCPRLSAGAALTADGRVRPAIALTIPLKVN